MREKTTKRRKIMAHLYPEEPWDFSPDECEMCKRHENDMFELKFLFRDLLSKIYSNDTLDVCVVDDILCKMSDVLNETVPNVKPAIERPNAALRQLQFTLEAMK
jgi:hypothetical protein